MCYSTLMSQLTTLIQAFTLCAKPPATSVLALSSGPAVVGCRCRHIPNSRNSGRRIRGGHGHASSSVDDASFTPAHVRGSPIMSLELLSTSGIKTLPGDGEAANRGRAAAAKAAADAGSAGGKPGIAAAGGGARQGMRGGGRGGASPAAMAQLVRSSAHNAKAIDKLSTDMSSLKENLARIEGLLVGSEARSKRPPGQNLSA